jgi:hypothetical protein
MSIIKEDPSWVTKYNGFNNGKDASEGVGGNKIPLQIKAMSKTKEEIIRAMGLSDPDGEIEDVMETYAAQRVNEFKEKLILDIKAIQRHNKTVEDIIKEYL